MAGAGIVRRVGVEGRRFLSQISSFNVCRKLIYGVAGVKRDWRCDLVAYAVKRDCRLGDPAGCHVVTVVCVNVTLVVGRLGIYVCRLVKVNQLSQDIY